jgi:hypothetical protein
MNITAVSRRLLNSENDNYLVIPILVAILEGAFLADARTLAITILAFGLFALPGFVVFRRFTTSIGRAVVYGLPLGYSLTSLLIITVTGLRGWDISVISVAYLLGVTALSVARYLRSAPRAAPAPESDNSATPALPLIVALGLALTVLTLYVPLAHAGRLTANGYAYTALFGHDFILRGLDSVAVANSIPSDNYFFDGQTTYNYYILWYILPATVYNLLGKHAAITSVVSIIDLLNVPILGALVYYALVDFLRTITTVPVASVRLSWIFILLFVCAYSYHWLFYLVTDLGSATIPALAVLSTKMGPISTSWFKDFLFQPHSLLALMQFLVVMHLALMPAFRLRGILLGVLLGSLLLTDTVIFLVAGSAFAIWYLTQTDIRTRVIEFCLLSVTGAVIVGLCFSLRIFIVPEYSNRIILSPYGAAIAALPVLLPLCLGPLPVFGLLALKERAWNRGEQWRLLLILLAVSLFFMLFVTEVLEGNVFLRKGLLTLRLPLIILSASYLYMISFSRLRKVSFALLALALPTLFTDIYASSNTDDARYTTYVQADDMAAAVWLRDHTPQHAIVQSLIEYPGRFEYSATVIFGERKAALGFWKLANIRYPNKEGITRRVREIEALFSTTDVEQRADLVRALHIDYIFIGSHERARFPGIDARIAADTVHFREVYASATVKVYQVRT